MSRRRSLSVILVCLLVWLPGCSSYSRVDTGEVASYGKARITLTDGTRLMVAHPQVEADSLVGYRAGSWVDRLVQSEACSWPGA